MSSKIKTTYLRVITSLSIFYLTAIPAYATTVEGEAEKWGTRAGSMIRGVWAWVGWIPFVICLIASSNVDEGTGKKLKGLAVVFGVLWFFIAVAEVAFKQLNGI